MTALQRSCPHCGFINAADASFCGNCGRSMAGGTVTSPAGSMTLCPHCERENPAGADFCGHCGQTLTGRVAPPPEPVPPPENVHKRRSILPILVAAFGLVLFVAAAAAVFLLRDDAVPPATPASLPEEDKAREGAPPGAEEATDELAAGTSSLAPAGRTSLPVAAGEDNTPTLAPTVTPFPTSTLRPTVTPLPTRTPLPPTIQPPPTPLPPTALPATTNVQSADCRPSPGDRWGPTLWERYKDTLGCAVTDVMHPNSAYQYYQHAVMVWREVPDLVYVLYNDGTYDLFPAEGPDGYFDSDWLKGSFGYLWKNNATVRNRVGQPEAAEFNTTNFAVQDFAGGTIFYFLENDARNYVLFSDNKTWTWTQG